MVDSAGVKLITVEQAFGSRDYMVTTADDPMALQVRTIEQLWHKENMLNLGFKHAASMGAREIAWVDADCRYTGQPKQWFEETWHALQHYEFVQMLEYLVDLDLNNNPLGSPQKSFMGNYIASGSPSIDQFIFLSNKNNAEYGYNYGGGNKFPGVSGLAWAANVETGLNKIGGLMDFSILGANDWYTAHALVGMLSDQTVGIPPGTYMNKMLQYQTLCERWIKRDVGVVKGTVLHDFHGRKALRGYGTRNKILNDNKYDPDTDIKYDTQGLLQLETWEPRQIKMRDQIRAYFASRNEDSTTDGEG